MRNVFAHGYGTIILESTWETLQTDIPALKEKCQALLRAGETSGPSQR